MKAKLREIEKAERAFTVLVNTPLPGRLAYQVSKLVRILRSELEALETGKKALIDRIGVEDPKCKGVFIAQEGKQEEWDKELDELRVTEVDLGDWPLDETILDRVQLTPADVEALEPFLQLKEKADPD